MDGDPATAAALVHAATSDGIDVRALYLQVLQPALYEIGRRWEEAEKARAKVATGTLFPMQRKWLSEKPRSMPARQIAQTL